MTETAHTPGPWEIRDGEEGYYIGAKDGGRYVRIATMCGSMSNPDITADANLIVAAPKMLALLKHLYEYGYTNFADHDRVRDMISKAEGRS